MPSYFRQIIFPPNPTRVIVAPTTAKNETRYGTTEIQTRALFEYVHCLKKNEWFSMIKCLTCPEATKTLEEIMENNIGCLEN